MTPRAACADQVKAWQGRMEQALAERLPVTDTEPTRLHAAMRYCVLNGGQRLRPLLLFGTARAVGLREVEVEAAACAIEFAHAYSSVHDDLPAIDDDDVRRGRPTCHKAYDEGTAVLVGDALQSLAFQLLASDAALPAAPLVRLRLIALLAEAIGASGLAGGQAIDVAAQPQHLSVPDLDAMHARRTGALIRASVLMAAACAPQAAPHVQEGLAAFALPLALAVQIQHDLRPAPSDAARSRATYAAALGPAASRERIRQLHAQALEALQPLGTAADPLRALADWLLVAAD
ncbi:MAG TPA: polyprenyl synthetase family protein [Steroidobacteraceae bacterium]